MIKAQRVGQTIVCVIGEKMYQKVLSTDVEILELFELALNTDENNAEELKTLKSHFTPSLTHTEKIEKKEFENSQLDPENKKELVEWMEDIKSLGDEHFEVKGIKLYMKGIGITIPEFIAAEFASRRENEEDLNSLMNFWRLCALNSDPRCREDLYKFLINNNMVVTPSGYFLAYRNANVKNEGNRYLNEFIGEQVVKVKNWKKSTKNYTVLQNEEGIYSIKQNGLLAKLLDRTTESLAEIGRLDELYNKLQEERGDTTVYTDAHSGSTTIILGQPVNIPRENCDSDPNRTCSRGLHLGSTNFMTEGYFGSVGLVCLCNPMHVVAVPYADGQKLRTSEYLPVGIATFEYDYAEHTEEQLEEMLNNSSFESLKEHKIIPQDLTYEDFRDMVSDFSVSTDEMKKTIQNRVQNV
jgi:hypothetical protein